MRTIHSVVLAGAIIGVFGLESVAHTAPRATLAKRIFQTNDKITLKTGEQVNAARYAAELDKLQEALESDGVSLKKSDHKPPPARIPMYKGAEQEKVRDKATLSQKSQQLAAIEAGGFLALRKTRAGAPITPQVAPSGGPPKPGTKINTAPVGANHAQLGPGVEGPLSVGYEEVLGTKKRASIYVGMSMHDTGDATNVGCSATLDGGVYVFDHQAELVKMVASGKVAASTMSGEVDLYLLGKSVDGFPKKGSSTLTWSKSIAPPAAKMSYGWGPLSISVEASIAGELKVNGGNTQVGPNATAGGQCKLTATPSVHASAKAKASLDVIAYRIGVEGQITLIDLKTPLTASVGVKKNPSMLTEDFIASIDASFLEGNVDFVVDTRIPQSNEHFWDLDWDQVYKKNLFDWDGLKIEKKLASFSGKQTSL